MKIWVKNVLVLQTADIKTKKMNRKLKEIPKEKEEILKEVEIERQNLNKAKENLREIEKEIKQLESKINEVKDKINDIQSKSAMVRKNDEYKAMMNEIAAQKSFISSLETKEIKLMDDLAEAKENYSVIENSIKNSEKEAAETIKELEEMEQILKSEIETALKNRESLLKNVDSTVLSIYSRLIKKEGEPIVKIVNNTCGYCHLKLTPQTLADAKKGLVVTCDTCGHIVYFDDLTD